MSGDRLRVKGATGSGAMNGGLKWSHTHLAADDEYEHDHKLLTRDQLRRHLDAQHQPRRLPVESPIYGRGVLDLDTGITEYER